MPAIVLDLKQSEDRRDIVHRAVQIVAEGGIIAMPTETSYCAVASGLDSDSVRRLISLGKQFGSSNFLLSVKSGEDALDYAPRMSSLGRRFARRCWPGPLTLMLEAVDAESAITQLPSVTRHSVLRDGYASFRVPAHDAFNAVSRLSVGPLVMLNLLDKESRDVTIPANAQAMYGEQLEAILDDGPSRFAQPATVVKVTGNDYSILREGVVNQAALQRFAETMILLVCTGNTCRSPMGEMLMKNAIAKKLGCSIEELEKHGVVVASAGTQAMSGGRASPEAVQAMAERGLDLRKHHSQPIHERLAKQADIILTMTQRHRKAILDQWPELAPRTALVSRDRGDVADPIGGPLEVYQACASQMDAFLQAWVDKLDFGSK